MATMKILSTIVGTLAVLTIDPTVVGALIAGLFLTINTLLSGLIARRDHNTRGQVEHNRTALKEKQKQIDTLSQRVKELDRRRRPRS